MLFLSRKKDQQIIFDGNIELVVIEIRSDRVKLGFVAPDDVPIHREELYHRILAQKVDSESAAADH